MRWFMWLFLLILTCYAGAVDKDLKVIGGVNANIVHFPYQLSLNTSKTYCGASIISADWALTAAHCFMYSTTNVSVRSGSINRNWGGTVHKAIAIHIHDKFSSKTADYDIAVVKVSPQFSLGNNGVAAVKLATSEPDTKTLAVVSGFGSTKILNSAQSSVLQSANMTIRSRNRCAFISDVFLVFGTKFTSRKICANAYFKSACVGDSGGPLVNPSTGEQVGIVSYALPPICVPGLCEFYTNIANLRSWVQNMTGV